MISARSSGVIYVLRESSRSYTSFSSVSSLIYKPPSTGMMEVAKKDKE